MSIRTHELARAAHGVVNARGEPNGIDPKKYGALAHKLPGLILQNGLAQATGFLLAKGEAEHHAVLDDLRDVLHSIGATDAADRDALHRTIIEADVPETMRLTRHSLAACAWIKRYVQGVLRIDPTGARVDEKETENAG